MVLFFSDELVRNGQGGDGARVQGGADQAQPRRAAIDDPRRPRRRRRRRSRRRGAARLPANARRRPAKPRQNRRMAHQPQTRRLHERQCLLFVLASIFSQPNSHWKVRWLG